MENSWYSSRALWGSWRQFNYMEDKSLVTCESLEQSKMFWEAYQHFYYTNKQPTFRQLEDGETFDKETKSPFLYVRGSRQTYEDMASNLKPSSIKQKGMVHSIIGGHHPKGIPDWAKCIVEEHLSSYDLGDSRNFESTEQLIYKLTKLRNAKVYLGSVTSWSRIGWVFGLGVYKV